MNSTPNYGFDLNICGGDALNSEFRRLEEKIDSKHPHGHSASKCEFAKHLIDPHAHGELFDKKVDKKDGCRLICEDELQGIHDGLANRYMKDETYSRDEMDVLLSGKANKGDLYPSGALQLYVSPNGSDLNDGLSTETPFLTIKRAGEELHNPDNFTYNSVTINLAHGEYRENEVNLTGPQPSIVLSGDMANKAAVVIHSNQIFIRSTYGVNILGITAIRLADAPLNQVHVAVIPRGYISNCSFTGNKNDRGVQAGETQLYILTSSASNYKHAFHAGNLGQMNILNCSGSNNDVGLYCDASIMFVSGGAPSGTTAQTKVRGGQIFG